MATSMKKITDEGKEKTAKTTTRRRRSVSADIETANVRRHDKDDLIPCRSQTIGTLIMEGLKTRETYSWTSYGDVTDVAYQDLTSLIGRNSEYIFSPLFIIEEDDVVEEFPKLKEFYESQFTERDLEDIFQLDKRAMIDTIEKLPNRAKETLKTLASIKVQSGEIDSIDKIRTLDECFDTELNLLSQIIH